PASLVAELKKLRPKLNAILNKKAKEGEEGAPQVEAMGREKIRWDSEEAGALYSAFSLELDELQNTDKAKYDVAARSPENAERLATIVAGGCFSSTVDQRDIGWGINFARASHEANHGGLQKYMKVYYEFPKFCEVALEAIRSNS